MDHLHPELIITIAGYLYPKDKNRMMRTCQLFSKHLKNRTAVLLANPNTVFTSDKIEDLCVNVKQGNPTMIQFLLNDVDCNRKNSLGVQPLFYAKDENIKQLLYARGATALNNSIDYLHELVYNNNEKKLKKILDCKIKSKDASLLQIACRQGYENIVHLLLHHKNYVIQDKQSCINIAIARGYFDIVKLMIDEIIHIDMSLQLAAYQGHDDIVQLLIDGGADIHFKNYNGATAIYCACIHGHIKVIQLLIDHGANINESLWTPLHAASANNYSNVVKLLINSNVLIDKQCGNGNTALYLACEQGHINIVKLLLCAQADINIKNKNNTTCLMIALINGFSDIAKLLLHSDINSINNFGKTALAHALWKNHPIEIISKLIELGADVHHESEGWTMLNIAAYYSSIDVVKLLLCYNVDQSISLEKDSPVDLLIKKGDAALSIARKKGRIDIVNLLI